MTTYNKLVRDGIPAILEQNDQAFKTETLNQDRYIMELKKKLNEEVMEYQDAANDEDALEELADILEVMQTLVGIHDTSMEEVEKRRVKKAEEYGGFEEKIYLIDVEEK
ncbi:nucleoside triphosphate pyrophosphohydrolase [Oceanobacillus alkalisoli]|uniref:nucleoside triphosphate pyrophosphohydrolase n=1 Tax=Oceanobacillus alkalisoli TaxID=2925113 RepID=UPI001EF0BB26|nr:nucleoside triphosphate pyrophosphohydrolase [Oceanobacillus alkalisoli]MCF3944239.1 nucleoside triphosphate pyrophosphohydrolase [Oceanobacillus alkalisoli]MCG5103152.1 nucleoside triphosphate pyrophosphohydrolase [Oceanobacillus alkalisoli]